MIRINNNNNSNKNNNNIHMQRKNICAIVKSWYMSYGDQKNRPIMGNLPIFLRKSTCI